MSASRTFTIAELADEFDVTPRAIRFYEDQGILQGLRGMTRGWVMACPREGRISGLRTLCRLPGTVFY